MAHWLFSFFFLSCTAWRREQLVAARAVRMYVPSLSAHRDLLLAALWVVHLSYGRAREPLQHSWTALLKEFISPPRR